MNYQREVTREEWEAYLDEALPPDEMAELEQRLREDPAAREVVADLISLRDAGIHTLGAVWRRHRLSCPSREELGEFLLGILEEEMAQFVHYHVKVVGCRFCQANLEDLQGKETQDPQEVLARRKRYFQSSTILLDRNRGSGT
ncbi:MAG: hypothetical protein NZ899_02310 [Thermoguttaceae bacterium]|nr:hypothetical protein [Thermoguttaceae bacterium]MDW8079841.1 hypothetical protein [Thermoguttaceae bacterium]